MSILNTVLYQQNKIFYIREYTKGQNKKMIRKIIIGIYLKRKLTIIFRSKNFYFNNLEAKISKKSIQKRES